MGHVHLKTTIGTGSCSPQNTCSYIYSYANDDTSHGVLAKETITLSSATGGVVALNDIVFGGRHNNTEVFYEDEMGVIGLGGGPLSLVSQIGSKVGGNKFSHRLVPFYTSPSTESKMSFGSGSEVMGDGVVKTSLISNQFMPALLMVTLKGISVGDKFVPFNSFGYVFEGNMFLDSGTALTLIPQDIYDQLAWEVRNQIPMAPTAIDSSWGNLLCYKTRTNLKGPALTVHFKAGASVVWTPTQTFIPVEDGIFCLAMQDVPDPVGTIGSFAQSNFLIGFDLEKLTLIQASRLHKRINKPAIA